MEIHVSLVIEQSSNGLVELVKLAKSTLVTLNHSVTNAAH